MRRSAERLSARGLGQDLDGLRYARARRSRISRLMRAHSPSRVQVKASGGVRALDFVLAAREIGVTRCGSSRTREILDEYRLRFS